MRTSNLTSIFHGLDEFGLANAIRPSVGEVPKNMFFLTCDAYGVLPPISKLTVNQAMYQYISGYTTKIAGTEDGVDEPVAVFSACFGAPFMPLHPSKYAELLGEKMKQHQINIWLVNTGWTEGPYGVGDRIPPQYIRAMIRAVLNGDLDEVEFVTDPYFGLSMPTSCPGVPEYLLQPMDTWEDKLAYIQQAAHLIAQFHTNFEQFEGEASSEILLGALGREKVLI